MFLKRQPKFFLHSLYICHVGFKYLSFSYVFVSFMLFCRCLDKITKEWLYGLQAYHGKHIHPRIGECPKSFSFNTFTLRTLCISNLGVGDSIDELIEYWTWMQIFQNLSKQFPKIFIFLSFWIQIVIELF